jgi:enoyl-CoA hydratase
VALVELIRRDDGVAELVLNRPEKLNAFNPPMLDEFSRTVGLIGDDAAIRCVVLRGEGRAFSVGYDVQQTNRTDAVGYAHANDTYGDWSRLRRNLERWLDIWDLPIPVVAAVHGHCIGGASMLCVCADLTIVADDARIGWPSVPLGGGLLSPVSLWLVGMKRARELSYIVGGGLTAEEAVALGWANRSVPADRLIPEAMSVARQIARLPISMLRLKKLALNRLMEVQGFRTAFLFGAEWDAIAHAAPEHTTMRAKIEELGLKGAIRWFDEGGLLEDEPPAGES